MGVCSEHNPLDRKRTVTCITLSWQSDVSSLEVSKLWADSSTIAASFLR